MNKKYMNWPLVCNLARRNMFLAIALVNLNLSDDFDQGIADKFPEYFLSENPQNPGPVPLSMIMLSDNDEFPPDRSGWYDIPVFVLAAPGKKVNRAPTMPNKDWQYLQEAETFEWNGEKFIVIWNIKDSIEFIPAKCVDMTL